MWGEETISTNILVAKSRVSPLTGTTILCMELQGLLQLSRLTLDVIRALDAEVQRVVLAGDSMCSILALKRDGLAFNPYFQNRLTEIQENLQEIKTHVNVLESVQKVEGIINPARSNSKPEDLQPGSSWQNGPTFL